MLFPADPDGYWLPGIVLASWSNTQRVLAPVRDPCNPASPWKSQASTLSKVVLVHALRVLYFLWAPFAKALSFTLWCCTALAALLAYCRRLATAFLGWQNEGITKHDVDLSRPFLSGLRRWHMTVGAQPSPALLLQSAQPGHEPASVAQYNLVTVVGMCSLCSSGQPRLPRGAVLPGVLQSGCATGSHL